MVYVLGKIFPKKRIVSEQNSPTLTVVLAAYNEDQRIVNRLRNLLETNYSAEKIDIILVSDGSTDTTVEKAKSLNNPRIHVLAQATKAGKASCLNAGIAVAKGEIIIFGDVRQRFTPETIPLLVQHFQDPKVGAVSGSLEIDSSASAVGGGVDAYWKLEKFIRFHESQLDSSIGCTGAVYAIRRSLYRDLPADTLLDDVVTPMQIATQGFRVLFEPKALAFDPQSLEPEREWIRKQRTLAGNFQMLFRYLHWMFPWSCRLWWQLISHKYLRLAAPWLMALALISNALLLENSFYRWLFYGQCAFYLLAVLGAIFRKRKNILFSVPAGFVFLNLTAMRGFWHYLRPPAQPGWQSTHVKSAQT